MATAPNVDAYIAGAPADQQDTLQTLRERLHQLVPDSTETISYQIPTIKYRGKGLVGFGTRTGGCSLYLMSTAATEPLADALSPYEVRGTTVWFTPHKPLTLKALRAIVKHRIAEVDARLDPSRGTRA